MHVHEQKWTDNKKIDDEVTLSHVGKSTTQSRRTKYLKNRTLIEDYNASRTLKVQASRVSRGSVSMAYRIEGCPILRISIRQMPTL